MKLILPTSLLLILFCACNQESLKQKRDANQARDKFVKDSISQAKRLNDSLSIASLSSKKVIYNGDKTLYVLQQALLSKKVKFEFEFGEYNNFWREKLAERDKHFLSIRIKLNSKSKPSDPSKFFPNLNVFSIDKKKNKILFVGNMDYQLYKESKLNIAYLEQIYDFQESETFVCILEVNDKLKKPLIISINENKKNVFDKNNVVAIVN